MGALLIPDEMGLLGMSGLCALSKPYSMSVVECYSINLKDIRFFFKFLIVLLNLCVSFYSLFIVGVVI